MFYMQRSNSIFLMKVKLDETERVVNVFIIQFQTWFDYFLWVTWCVMWTTHRTHKLLFRLNEFENSFISNFQFSSLTRFLPFQTGISDALCCFRGLYFQNLHTSFDAQKQQTHTLRGWQMCKRFSVRPIGPEPGAHVSTAGQRIFKACLVFFVCVVSRIPPPFLTPHTSDTSACLAAFQQPKYTVASLPQNSSKASRLFEWQEDAAAEWSDTGLESQIESLSSNGMFSWWSWADSFSLRKTHFAIFLFAISFLQLVVLIVYSRMKHLKCTEILSRTKSLYIKDCSSDLAL